ncbi:MAG: hypothetical protein ACKVPX_11340 [Myxococcaceae bacterium]
MELRDRTDHTRSRPEHLDQAVVQVLPSHVARPRLHAHGIPRADITQVLALPKLRERCRCPNCTGTVEEHQRVFRLLRRRKPLNELDRAIVLEVFKNSLRVSLATEGMLV